jgi:hypothetical protein
MVEAEPHGAFFFVARQKWLEPRGRGLRRPAIERPDMDIARAQIE